MIHPTPRESARKAMSLSFVAFNLEKSIEVELDSTGSGGELSVLTRIPSARTNQVVGNIKSFEGVR